tara:strand:+ start:1174 stop:1329 length:156 start_codon:yes stop_codon:yes gene_type:complete
MHLFYLVYLNLIDHSKNKLSVSILGQDITDGIVCLKSVCESGNFDNNWSLE